MRDVTIHFHNVCKKYLVEPRLLLIDNNGMFLVVVEVGVLRHDVDLHGVVVDADVVAVWHNASPVRHRVPLLGMGGQVFLVEGHEVALWALKIYKCKRLFTHFYIIKTSKDKLEDMDVSLTFCHFP